MTKALQKIKNNFSLIRALPFSSRILFINVFIVSLFSSLPTELWKKIKNAISKVVIPVNGGAFNISLLAVRSPLFRNPTHNYFSLPSIGIKFNMHIKDHRDAAAVDFWRSRHLPDGRLVPLPAPSSTEVYKILVDDVYLDDTADQVSKKISNFLQVYQPGLPPIPPRPPHRRDQKFGSPFPCSPGPSGYSYVSGQQCPSHLPSDEAPKSSGPGPSGPLFFLWDRSGLPPSHFFPVRHYK